jgi:competence protein ComEC
VNRLDRVILTHLDEDHSGALGLIAHLAPIAKVLVSVTQLESDRGRALRDALPTWQEAGTQTARLPLEFFALPESQHGAAGNRRMNAILVRLKGGGFYLNLGDADRETERKLIGRLRFPAGRPRILKISHHGSRGSTAAEFVDWVDPDVAWVSVGAGNPHGHPAPEVVSELGSRGVPLLRTDRDGELSWSAAAKLHEIK